MFPTLKAPEIIPEPQPTVLVQPDPVEDPIVPEKPTKQVRFDPCWSRRFQNVKYITMGEDKASLSCEPIYLIQGKE